MNSQVRYEAWKQSKANQTAPPGFADRVMDSARGRPPRSAGEYGSDGFLGSLAAHARLGLQNFFLRTWRRLAMSSVAISDEDQATRVKSSCVFRVDLSADAVDFQPRATEPGVPMIDSGGANYKILSRRLGALIVEPEPRGENSASFFLRDQDGGRIERLECAPATRADWEGALRDEWEEIGSRLRKFRADSFNEKALGRILRNARQAIDDDASRDGRQCFLFKFREPDGPWRLALAWGYQRVDDAPAQAVICENADCKQLYLHRDGAKRICPGCGRQPSRRRGGWSVPLCLLLLLFLGLALPAWLWRTDSSPDVMASASPEQVEIVVGELYPLDVAGSDGKATSSHPEIAQVLDGGMVAGFAEGTARVVVDDQDETRTLEVTVVRGPLEEIAIVPPALAVAVGENIKFRVVGKRKGREIELDPRALKWTRVPQSTRVEFNPAKLTLTGIAPNTQQELLEAQMHDLTAVAEINVLGLSHPGEFGVHPPLLTRRDVPRTARELASRTLSDSLISSGLHLIPSQGARIGRDAPAELLAAGVPMHALVEKINRRPITSGRAALDLLAVQPRDEIQYLDPRTGLRNTVRVPSRLAARPLIHLRDVELVGQTGQGVRLILKVRLLLEAEYRVTDQDGEPLADWASHGPDAEAAWRLEGLRPQSDAGEYTVFVEKKTNGEVQRFPIGFALTDLNGAR
ncbi:MAG: Ig-like domain-containing protein [Planctomycetales bacterium]